MLFLKCAMGLAGAMLVGAFAKGVLLGGAGATLTAVSLAASAAAMRGCCQRGGTASASSM